MWKLTTLVFSVLLFILTYNIFACFWASQRIDDWVNMICSLLDKYGPKKNRDIYYLIELHLCKTKQNHCGYLEGGWGTKQMFDRIRMLNRNWTNLPNCLVLLGQLKSLPFKCSWHTAYTFLVSRLIIFVPFYSNFILQGFLRTKIVFSNGWVSSHQWSGFEPSKLIPSFDLVEPWVDVSLVEPMDCLIGT